MKTSRKRKSIVVGVTGGIGSGKSEVCRLLHAMGAQVLSADLIAREIIDTHPDVKRRIRKAFGENIYKDNGHLDRMAMASLIFDDDRLKISLNRIVHHVVLKDLRKKILSSKSSKGPRILVVEAALIYEAHAEGLFDVIVVVDADEQMQVDRISERNGITRNQVQQRITSQLPSQAKAAKADFVIHNTRSLETLKENCTFLFKLLRTLAVSSFV